MRELATNLHCPSATEQGFHLIFYLIVPEPEVEGMPKRATDKESGRERKRVPRN